LFVSRSLARVSDLPYRERLVRCVLAPARVRWGGRLRGQLGARGRDQSEQVRRVALRASGALLSCGSAAAGRSLLYHWPGSSLAIGGAPVSWASPAVASDTDDDASSRPTSSARAVRTRFRWSAF